MVCIKFTPDGTKIVTASSDNTLKVIDMRSSNTLHSLEHSDLIVPTAISKFAISPDGQFVVVGGHQGMIFIFNLITGRLEEAYDEEHNVSVLGVDWAPGSASTIATMDKSGLLYVWK